MARLMFPPGFRFHPTDEELVLYFLKRKVMGKPCHLLPISEIELYKFAPWDLPDMSCLRTKDLEWYFFCPRDKKYPNGSRANRSTEIGFWKVTGKDRSILHDSRIVGMKKSLIFHTGKPPKGDRTDWVMYEYRLSDDRLATSGVVQDAYVICKIFKKSGLGPKIGEQYGAPFNDEDWEDADLEASVAAFPFLPSFEQPSNGNCATTSSADPVPLLLDATAVPVAVDATAVPMPVPADPVPKSTSALAIGEPVSLSVAISTKRYEELPIATGPNFGMPQCGTAVPDMPEMDGIELDELAAVLLDSPYRPNYVSVSSQVMGRCRISVTCDLFLSAPQLPSPAEVNMSEYFGELVCPLDILPIDGNELARPGSSVAVATDDNAAQAALSEPGSQNYIELNDILFDPEDDYFPDYSHAVSSPGIDNDFDVNSFFSNGPTTSDSQKGRPT